MRSVIWIGVFFLVALLAYYFFMMRYSFKIEFTANTTAGNIIQTLRIWDRSHGISEITSVDSVNALTQSVRVDDKEYVFRWTFQSEKDTVTSVTVEVSQPGKDFENKFLVPFTNQQIEKDSERIVREFYDILKSHLAITRVRIEGESAIDSAFCICSALETRQIEKANGMMRYYLPISSFIAETGLEVKGPPSVRIREWSHNRGTVKFDFCFPIVLRDSMPGSGPFFYRRFEPQRTVKASYYGNYITSDRAWYQLVLFAAKNDYVIKSGPVEIFHNNPNLGLNEKEWRAEIHLPVE